MVAGVTCTDGVMVARRLYFGFAFCVPEAPVRSALALVLRLPCLVEGLRVKYGTCLPFAPGRELAEYRSAFAADGQPRRSVPLRSAGPSRDDTRLPPALSGRPAYASPAAVRHGRCRRRSRAGDVDVDLVDGAESPGGRGRCSTSRPW